MTRITRRDAFKAGSGALMAAGMVGGVSGARAMTGGAIADDLAAYIAFGPKQSGGPGDCASGDWMHRELTAAGFAVERQTIDVPWFDPAEASLALIDVPDLAPVPLLPMAIVIPTPPQGVTAQLVWVHPVTGPQAGLEGAIALIELPHGRWSSAMVGAIREPLEQAAAAGAVAAVIITTGPTGAAIALNADGRRPLVPIPVAILAPDAAAPVMTEASQGRSARLTLTGAGGRRPATNLAARLDRGAARWMVVSTPRSGWTICAGERGPGIAAFLALARWAPVALPDHNLLFLCNSGHEYENLGAEHALDEVAPPPASTAFWLHLGANLAARDWHEAGQGRLLPLPSADPQRYLVTSADIVDLARARFAGLPGLENAYPGQSGTAGELGNIVARGYPRFAGIFGGHRFHHVAQDDSRCVHPPLIDALVQPLQSLLLTVSV